MTSSEDWLGYGNVACLIPLMIMFIRYVIKTDWSGSDTGRALAWLITLTIANFILNFAGTVSTNEWWDWIRVGIKFSIALGLLNMVRVMQNVQNEHQSGSVDVREDERKD